MTQANIGGPSPFWQQYAYDAVGNRTKKVVRTSAGASTTVNTFGQSAGPHARTTATTTSPTGVVTTTGYAFDAAGNQTSTMVGADQKTLGWDAEGELASVSGGSTNDSNLFDASGSRLMRTDASGSTVYLPGGTEVTVSTSNVVSVVRWYSFGGKTVAYRTGPGAAKQYDVFTDHQGTPVGTILNTNWAGGITRTRTDPYGAARATVTGTAGHGFLAASVDTTGLVALGARYYDPGSGVFVSVDPLLDNKNTAQFNAYVYSGNNPLTWSDPSGFAWNLQMRLSDGGSFKAPGRVGPTTATRGLDTVVRSDESKDDTPVERWNRSWAGVGERWTRSWQGFGSRWNEAWQGFGSRWNEAWNGVPGRWNKSTAAVPERVTNSVKGIPSQVSKSYEHFMDNPEGRSWKRVAESASAGVNVSACAFVCGQVGVAPSGWSYGFGIGADVGIAVSVGVSAQLPPGWSVHAEASGAVGPVGVYGELGVTKGPSPVVGGGFTSGARAGVSAWIVNEVSW